MNRKNATRHKPFIILIIAILSGIVITNPVHAQNEPGGEKDRTAVFSVEVTYYNWWLTKWSNNSVLCTISIDHEGLPTTDELKESCGQNLFSQWQKSAPCPQSQSGGDVRKCTGLYLQSSQPQTISQEMIVELPVPKIWLTISGCVFEGNSNLCTGTPALRFSGEEKLPNESIIRIQGDFDGESFICDGSECEIPLTVTDDTGVRVNFWGESSYGDLTEEYLAVIRVIPATTNKSEGEEESVPSSFYVDMISTQQQGERISSCAAIWEAFPDADGLPEWLETPDFASELNTALSLHYLSAKLIENGIVDASYCPDGGIESANVANQCGIEAASDEVGVWQNQFDEEILKVSTSYEIPARVLKNLFIHESQLWPGTYPNSEEVGLGQLTSEGAEAALLWNSDFYGQFCPLVFSDETCDLGYANLGEENQLLLRAALKERTNATCPDCAYGIDMDMANYSVDIFAQTLLGNCAQVSKILRNLTGKTAGQVSSYNDLWRFTLVNYNAGPGCLWSALSRTWKARDALNWENVAANLDPACRGAVTYVREISKGDTADIILFSTPLPSVSPTILRTATSTPAPTLTITPTMTPTLTLTPTATLSIAITEDLP
jgi:hypothetical protein